MSPVSSDPEDLARALAKCAEIDTKYDEFLGPEGQQTLDEIHEQNAKFRRQDEFIARKHLQRALRKEHDHES